MKNYAVAFAIAHNIMVVVSRVDFAIYFSRFPLVLIRYFLQENLILKSISNPIEIILVPFFSHLFLNSPNFLQRSLASKLTLCDRNLSVSLLILFTLNIGTIISIIPRNLLIASVSPST